MKDQFKISHSVDARGLRCPIPLLRAKQALKALLVGDYLEVLTTDPSAKGDFDAMLKHLPHTLESHSMVAADDENGTEFERFVIRKA
ncbi:sulfurtransferase TusA family protein [Arenicella xantha]|uniref:tRNA 2-thiouridine synthesizing protein A n=1 Tax=Arenicella xantha TaxID=644221 RepID=A0A395JQF8_9GAMM|nr:sulfurtransferase TusA family protein [Arenicella xantha]RBP52676.1 tRNA 2-thiouridine synthesizing protein A [Arenicella xantha]